MIHESTVIEDGAIIGDNVKIGPFCYIKSCVTIEDDCELASHISLGTSPQSQEPANPNGRVIIREGTLIKEFVTVNQPCKEKTIVGKNCILMSISHIAHDCLVGNNVILTSGSGLSGYCVVGDGTVISGLCHIHQFSKIGRYCMIGSSTFFKGDSPDGLVWVSNGKVAVPLKVNKNGLDRHNPIDREEVEIKALKFLQEYSCRV